MPRFHASFSGGTIAGAVLGVPATAFDLPVLAHLGLVAVLALAVTVRQAGAFLEPHPDDEPGAGGPQRSAWREPRTLAIGVMVLAFAVLEGSANDRLTLALIDGYDVDHWVGVAGYALFLTAMTGGRLLGTGLLIYGTARFSMEWFREPDRGLENLSWGLTMGQTLSAPMIIAGLYLVLTSKGRRQRVEPVAGTEAVA